jgi:hypothetical protein
VFEIILITVFDAEKVLALKYGKICFCVFDLGKRDRRICTKITQILEML